MVYDLGGGTFDVSVIEIGAGVIEVLATSGDNRLGGDDYDARIVDYLVKEFKQQEKIDLSKDPMAMQRLREEAEKAKKELSSAVSCEINLPFIASTKDGGKHLDMTLTRAKFEELTYDLTERTVIPVKNALSDAGLNPGELDKVLLVGGSTRMPAVQTKVEQMTGKIPSKNLNQDECVALGAAIQGGKLAGEEGLNEVLLMDVTPLSLAIETVGGVATRLIEKNSTIPTRYSQIFTTAGNFQTSVDIKVLQGERQFARDNKLIGNFRLSGIKRAMRGVPQIEVTFDIDVNGILSVSAKDLGTGKEQHITITTSSNLSEEEIQRAIYEAQMYESQDKEKKSFLDIYNEAEQLAFRTDQALAAAKKEITKEEKSAVKEELNALKKKLRKIKPEKMTPEDVSGVREAKERLERTARDLLERTQHNSGDETKNTEG